MKNIINILFVASVLFFSSCEDWLTQENSKNMSLKETYSSVSEISSVAANLYSRLRYEQDFGENYSPKPEDPSGRDLMDIAKWDEASQNSAYWEFAGNVNRDYRRYYDYELVRDINIHIQALQNESGPDVPKDKLKYFLAEARYIRAFVYFTLVSRMGGVPIITEPMEYTENTIELARPRNKESEVYDFIVTELDAILNDLDLVSSVNKTRATKGSALALKCRAMLYAGTIAYNYDKNVTKGLILPSGATGIEKEKAKDYLQKCLDAYFMLLNDGKYSLYKNSGDLAKNYTDLFQTEVGNPEIILCRAYDGATFQNDYTSKSICAKMRSGLKTGCELNPVLNLVNCYEEFSSRTMKPINPYVGAEQKEEMKDGISTYDYKIYDKPEDIFADRDPRLKGTILYPGSSFRGSNLPFQAGLAIKVGNSYEFKTVGKMEDINSAENLYNGIQITGEEGPHRTSTYISHTGFLMRKFVDVNAGSESKGGSKVPYPIFRYGEVLLNAAEAAFYLSEIGVASYNGKETRALALNCVNEIRNRAGGAAFEITASELNFNRIANERRVELAFEDHRYNDLKRWRIADEVWAYDQNNPTSIIYGLWPYKIYAPLDPSINGKWVYRKVKLEHRGNVTKMGDPLNFDRTMFYATYPITDCNPYIEKNPNH